MANGCARSKPTSTRSSAAGREYRHPCGDVGVGADLERHARDRLAGASSDRDGAGLGGGQRIPQRRVPSALAWAPTKSADQAGRPQAGRAPPGAAYREIAGFMSDRRVLDDEDSRALELAILCASRSIEVLEAPRERFEKEEGEWVTPKSG